MTIGVSDPFNRAQELCDDKGGCPGLPVHENNNTLGLCERTSWAPRPH